MALPVDILTEAAATISLRASDRDLEQERSMKGTVDAFNAIFGTNLTEHQGWMFMVLLKAKRSAVGPYKEDDFVDGAAYFGLAAEARKAGWESSDAKRLADSDKAQAQWDAAVIEQLARTGRLNGTPVLSTETREPRYEASEAWKAE